ncbi:MAG: hypothetical protein CSA11_05315 [Chloroflexi bacterium]|nr:MAG: hypothetical protein CSA11_05315 [Chloroflexota bacterium]
MEEKLECERYDIISAVSTEVYSAFLIKSDSSLWVIEKNTYDIIGRVEFSGGSFIIGDINKFTLDAKYDHNIVVVYLGDSQ